VSAPISARALKEMSATIFLGRLWKILRLVTSIRQPNRHVNNFLDKRASVARDRNIVTIAVASEKLTLKSQRLAFHLACVLFQLIETE
jgi:hypothetical protein